MTTIVATRTGLYSESMVSCDVPYNTRKLFRVGSSILGFAGTLSPALRFIEWFNTKDFSNPPVFEDDDDFDVLELSPSGMFKWGPCLLPREVLDPFYAIGSGSCAALAALHLGTSPEVAIETACKVDPSSGGPLQVLHLLPHNANLTQRNNHTKGRSSTPKAGSSTPKK